MKNKKKPIILITAILLAVITAVSAATFAWFTAQDQVVNRIETAKLSDGDVSIIETFDPTDRLEPGVDINKDVGAINTGDAPVLVRISFSEVLMKLQEMDRQQDMQVRRAKLYDGSKKFLPQLVDISKFADDSAWTEIADMAALNTWLTAKDLFFLDAASKANMEALFDEGIIFQVKQTQTNPTAKFSWSAYAPYDSTPVIYQRVELRPELFNLVRQSDPAANLDGGTRDEADLTIYDETGLQVVLTDPTNTLYQDGATYLNTIAAIDNNGSGRFYNFIELQWANNGSGYKADWRYKNTTRGTEDPYPPVGDTHPAASNYAAGKMPAVTFESMTYMDGTVEKYFLELLFHDANVVSSIPTSASPVWWYNPADGFFYYCEVLEPGQSTALLLDAISLSGAAESDFSHTKFNLTVYMDAIQATEEAVTSTVGGGWGANDYDGDPLVPDSGIGQFLRSICPS